MEGSIHWAQLPLFPLGRLSVVLLCEGEVSVYAALDACFSVLSCEGYMESVYIRILILNLIQLQGYRVTGGRLQIC